MGRKSPGTLVIENPKLRSDDRSKIEDRLFPYYAGFSARFAERLLTSAELSPGSLILDPWNGSGTTTLESKNLGFQALGFDLNPVMVVVAKASLLSHHETPSLKSLAEALVVGAEDAGFHAIEDDPLLTWFAPQSAACIRSLETQINSVLVRHRKYQDLSRNSCVDQLSSLAAFFYVALFRAVRRLLIDFVPSNPTWIRHPLSMQARKRPSWKVIAKSFQSEGNLLSSILAKTEKQFGREEAVASIQLGSSERLPIENESVDFVLSSPPYCTRIDYAVATAIELAILRFGGIEFDVLRRKLMGTSTVTTGWPRPTMEWGISCFRFLEALYEHDSKASQSYYYKSHLQYFESLYQSLSELGRVLRKGGACSLVIQDSYYKDVHNDVPTIAEEMARSIGLMPNRRVDFAANQSMVVTNSRAKKYLEIRKVTESVLCFENRGH